MDPGNLNEVLDICVKSVLLGRWNSNYKAVVDKVEYCEILLNRQTPLLSSLKSDFNERLSQEFSFEATTLQDIRTLFHEAEQLTTNAITLIEAMKPSQGLFQNLLVHIKCSSEGDWETALRESSDCIKLFEKMASSICEIASGFEKAVNEIQERLRASTVACNATDSNK
ncbi:hypothetical protein TNCT_126521 [Trichonephila clavata]|uniref:Uncharacterized protein n=1 Tax=Trichonephila clavata TaxID=2740835 RepID=A0A8X6HAP4_TRICU|nr:hypothetical protein TNCT_126521 [Trichonephila clavata]